MLYSDDELEMPEWVVNDPWLQELDACVWENIANS
jgi:hypothetical protein